MPLEVYLFITQGDTYIRNSNRIAVTIMIFIDKIF